MSICEAGLLFRGYTLVSSEYLETSVDNFDKDLRSGLLTAIITFAENAFDTSFVDYLESNNYVIAFTKDSIMAEDSIDPELILGYVILNRKKKIEKFIHKTIQPLLSQTILKFKSLYEGKNFSEISLFKSFKSYLESVFPMNYKKIDKIKTIF